MTDHRFDLVIADRYSTADDVVCLELSAPSGAQLPAWEPGAHIDLELGNGLIRQYSLCGSPADRTSYRVGVLRERCGRGGSEYVHKKLIPGTRVIARGPRNHFEFRSAPGYLFIAGGIGITPLLPMISTAAAHRAPWHLTYCGRSRASMGFQSDLGAYPGESVTLHPRNETRRLDMKDVVARWSPGTLIYCCGPESLIAAAENACAAMPPGTLRLERFTPKTMAPVVRTEAFDVVLAQSGVTLTVPPEKTILDALLQNGIDVDYCCSEGTCGSCETAVLEGQIDHRCSVLSDEERAAQHLMMVCVSRSAGQRLVLDL